MDTSKLIMGTIVGTIVFFLAGWLIYGMLLANVMESGMTPEGLAVSKAEPNLVLIALSNACWALMYAYIFERWAGIRTWMTGGVAGAILGFLSATAIDLSFLSMTNMFKGFGSIIPDILGSTVLCAIGGAAIGWALGYNRKS